MAVAAVAAVFRDIPVCVVCGSKLSQRLKRRLTLRPLRRRVSGVPRVIHMWRAIGGILVPGRYVIGGRCHFAVTVIAGKH